MGDKRGVHVKLAHFCSSLCIVQAIVMKSVVEMLLELTCSHGGSQILEKWLSSLNYATPTIFDNSPFSFKVFLQL